jgi:hypothetical protein
VLETATGGATSAGAVATVPGALGKVKKREDTILAQEKKETPKPRNFVAKNAKMGGAGQHKDKKKEVKQGNVKHKKPFAEGEVVPIGKKHKGDLGDIHSCPKCGGELQGGNYMGQRVKVCQPCKQVYLPPNSGIDQQGNKTNEQGVAEGKDDKIAQLKKDHDTAVHWSKNETSPQKREAARQKAEKIKAHLEKQYKQGVAEGQVTPNPYDRGYYDGQRMGSNSYHNPYSRADEPTEWDEYKSGFNMAQIELQNDLEDNGFSEGVAEGFNGEYDDEAGMAHTNLLTSARAVMGLLKTIDDKDNLPEWVQEKIAKAEMMLVGVWDYLQSQKEQGINPQVESFGRYGSRNPDTMSPNDYDRYQQDQMDQSKRDFKRREMDHELGHERNNYAVAIDGRTWKVFADQRQAQNIARSLQAKGKNATVHETGENPSESVDPYFESLRAQVEELAKK